METNADSGGSVLKGEKGHLVVFTKIIEKEEDGKSRSNHSFDITKYSICTV
ncbi:MAG: hypothetical protein IPI46_14650 [Bacteroidetes bacterium]|nr:hypothetical protein [Bacteroidota bacterium]